MPTATGLQFASAVSDAAETADAVNACLAPLTDSLTGRVDAAFLFATPHHRDHFDLIHRRVRDALGARHVVGMTAGGVIGVRRETEGSPGLSILAATMPGAWVHPFRTGDLNVHSDSPDAIRRKITGAGGRPRAADASSPNPDPGPAAVIMLADPFSCPMTNLLPAITAALPGTPLIGGIASGARQPGGNRLLLDGQIGDQGGIGLVLAGVRVDITVSQGCRPIGKPLVITKSQHNIIKELGGRQALEVMRAMLESLPDDDKELLQTSGWLIGRVVNEYKDRFGRGDFLIRQVIGVDPRNGYVAVGDANLRVGQTIQFHVRDRKTAREDFTLLLEAQKLHGNHGGALLFSCNGRGTNLFDSPNADATMIADALGDIPLAGCFAAGEIGPIGDENHLHGHTASLAVIRPLHG